MKMDQMKEKMDDKRKEVIDKGIREHSCTFMIRRVLITMHGNYCVLISTVVNRINDMDFHANPNIGI